MAPPTRNTERDAEIVERFLNDVSQQQIASDFGLTRQRVHQILVRELPNFAAIRREQKRQMAEKRRQERTRECRLCGKQFVLNETGRYWYCSKSHYRIWTALRYVRDEDYWRLHRKRIASWVLRHREKAGEVAYRLAQREMRGEVQEKGRWLVEGSQVFRYACMAYENKWPVFDLFPPEIAEQVIDVCVGLPGE